MHLILYILLILALPLFVRAADNYDCNKRQNAFQCQLCNCYHEARSESFDGMVAVVRNVLTRIESKRWPNNACGVIYERSQYSWTNGRSSFPMRFKKGSPDSRAYNNCKEAIRVGQIEGSNGATNYFNPKAARPRWARKMKFCGTIGAHAFYADGSNCSRFLGTDKSKPNKYRKIWPSET